MARLLYRCCVVGIMNKQLFTRRQFLQLTNVAGGALLLESATFGDSLSLGSVLTQPTVLIRKDIDALTAPEITALRTGVSVMQSRPATSPTSWIFQANIHGVPPDGGSNPAWSKCRHDSFFFLVWHRMYLYFFERILRAASGSPNLTLPYWNYSKTTPTARALPLAFRTPTTGNPLFVAQRNSGINTGALLPASAAQTEALMRIQNFTVGNPNFGGRPGGGGSLEVQPHNVIHTQIGGSDGWMRKPSLAARDPIFWLHHANIDRLWNQWLSKGGEHANPVTLAAWTTPKFSFFDETGAPVTMSACDILNSTTQLGYSYDTDRVSVGGVCPATPAPFAMASIRAITQQTIAAKQGNVVLGDQPVTVSVVLGTKAKTALKAAAEGHKTYLLNIEGITYTRQPGVHFEVYLNLPAGAGDPDWQGPHYVGNLAFFSTQHEDSGTHAAHAGARLTFDVTEVVRNLRGLNLWNENRLSVTFVARGLDNPDGTRQKPKVPAKPRFARISLIVE